MNDSDHSLDFNDEQNDVENVPELEMETEKETEGMTKDLHAVIDELKEKVEKLEGNLGVEHVVLTDIGDRVQVTVQTPLGCVVFPLPHTGNTSKKPEDLHDSPSSTQNHVMPTGGLKGAPVAGMTPEQLQDFKKQTLQISTLQQRIKELEAELVKANAVIKKDEDVVSDLKTKEMEDVKEIFLYLDTINDTMSNKMAEARVQMEKLAGDTPQPINYDPFNYGEAYAGDIVDFEARKRILELKTLLQGLNAAMAQMKDAVRISPAVDLGYKVIRMDELLEATGFHTSLQKGELTQEDGILITQNPNPEPPERPYPRPEVFSTDDDKGSTWAMADSMMQTLYRLEVELGSLQKSVSAMDTTTHVKDLEDLVASVKQAKGRELDEDAIKNMVHSEVENMKHATFRLSRYHHSEERVDHHHTDSKKPEMAHSGLEEIRKAIQLLKAKIRKVESRPGPRPDSAGRKCHRDPHACMTCNSDVERPAYGKEEICVPRTPALSPFTSPRNVDTYKQPVRLRCMLQRDYKFHVLDPNDGVYRIPRPHGRGYMQPWPRPEQPVFVERTLASIPRQVIPTSEENLIQGRDGHWYKGNKVNPKS